VRPKDYPRELLKQAIAEGKRVRKYYFGDFFPLSSVTVSPADWCVLQYHRPAEQDGMVVAFRRPAAAEASFVARLHEIDAAADYEITLAYTYQPSAPTRIKGADLRALKVQVPDRPGSVLIEYRKR
jgi:alpha-galactosidase